MLHGQHPNNTSDIELCPHPSLNSLPFYFFLLEFRILPSRSRHLSIARSPHPNQTRRRKPRWIP